MQGCSSRDRSYTARQHRKAACFPSPAMDRWPKEGSPLVYGHPRASQRVVFVNNRSKFISPVRLRLGPCPFHVHLVVPRDRAGGRVSTGQMRDPCAQNREAGVSACAPLVRLHGWRLSVGVGSGADWGSGARDGGMGGICQLLNKDTSFLATARQAIRLESVLNHSCIPVAAAAWTRSSKNRNRSSRTTCIDACTCSK